MSNPRSKRYWASGFDQCGPYGIWHEKGEAHNIPCEVVALDPGIEDLDYPPVGTVVEAKNGASGPYTVKMPPFKDRFGCVWLPAVGSGGTANVFPFSSIIWPPKPKTRDVTIRVPADTDIEQALKDIQGAEVVSDE